MATKFFKCLTCGNVAVKVVDHHAPLSCCSAKMVELTPNTVDASTEKHVPVVTRLDPCTICVKVGSEPHPMTPEHHIAFIYVETKHGGIRIALTDKPEVKVHIGNTQVVAVYEYCNLHGLWKTDVCF